MQPEFLSVLNEIFSSDEQAARPQSTMSENEFINRMREHMADEVGGYVCMTMYYYGLKASQH